MTGARFYSYVMQNPGRNGGLIFCALLTGLIVINAVWFQVGSHPAPLFQTRAPGGQLAILMSQTIRSVPGQDLRYPPLVADRALVSEVQSMLAVRGFFHGTVDGVDGPETRAAIAAFERQLGLPPSGEPSATLLARIRLAQIIADDVVLPERAPADNPDTASRGASDIVPAASDMGDDALASLIGRTQTPSTSVSTPAVERTMMPAPPMRPVTTPSAADPQVQTIQRALNEFGYGPIAADGLMGRNTEQAIRAFQSKEGLAATGKIDDQLLMRLITTGAMRPSS